MNKTRKHDSLVDIVKEELYDRNIVKVFDHVLYHNGVYGEIDVYGVKNDYVLLFEIKCNDSRGNRKKAENQLERARKYYFKHDKRVFKFFVYYDHNEPVYNWVRN